jgi:hypothetical protein
VKESEEEPAGRNDCFKTECLKWWNHYKPRLLPDIVRVAYLLSPNPKIMEHALANRDAEDYNAAERLLDKMMLPSNQTDDWSKMVASADLLDTFLSELQDFQMKRGVFSNQKIWLIASRPDCNAAQWHAKYSLPHTKVLGKFACRVCSKMIGTGEAERNWKQMKRQSKGSRGKLTQEKQKMQGTIAAAYCHEKGEARRLMAQKAGELWDDADFQECKFGEYCEGDIVPRPSTPNRIFRAWNESWERMQFKSNGCDLFAAKFSEKYGGLRFKDVDKDGRVGYTLKDNCAVLQKCYKGKDKRTEILPQKGFGWYYALLVCYDGYDPEQFYHQQSNELWELFELPAFDDFYEMVVEYYAGKDEIQVFKEGECDEYDAWKREVPFNGLREEEWAGSSDEEDGDAKGLDG